MASEQLHTQRLELMPHGPWHLLALIDSAPQYELAFGVPPADGLREFLVSGDVSPNYLAALRAASTLDIWTHGFGVVHAADRLVVGVASFKGPPADRRVEIAYGIVPAYENRGLATEAAQALVEFARSSGLVDRVLAHTLPEANASTRVLAKCGFAFSGEVIDPEDGAVWRWERPV